MRLAEFSGERICTLPDGQTIKIGSAQLLTVWRVWRTMAAVHAPLSEGVQIKLEEDGSILLRSVYSRRYEANMVYVDEQGGICFCSEQSAPDLPGL